MAGERKFIKDNVKRALLKEYLKEQVKRAGFGGVDIRRTPMGTSVTLITERPGLVIGRKGASIKALTDAIEFDFGFDKPQVEVVEVDNPNLSAQIMAEKLASALERGWHFRRAGHSTVRRIMEAGARGCQVIISGKLTGQRHRTEKFKEGHIKFCGEPKLQWMEEGYTPAKLKPGVIGVKVQIMHPNAKLPDEIKIVNPPGAVEEEPDKDKAKPEEEAAVKDVKDKPEKKAPSKEVKEKLDEPGPKEEKAPEAEKKAEEKAPEPKEEKAPEVDKEPPKPKAEKPKDLPVAPKEAKGVSDSSKEVKEKKGSKEDKEDGTS